MKRVCKSLSSPKELSDYIRRFPLGTPEHTWDGGYRNGAEGKARAAAVYERVYKDQKGLCAYCEIELLPRYDFRIDHFHPKDDDLPQPNHWQLRWDNMLGCCHGGTVFVYCDKGRQASDKTDQHCDATKGNKMTPILNPLNIPPFPRLFRYERRQLKNETVLDILPDEDLCRQAEAQGNVNCLQLARNTIDILGLSRSAILGRMRKAAKDKVNRMIAEKMKQGLPFKDAAKAVAKKLFPEHAQKWPPFFTVIRFQLKSAAECRLHEIEYNG